MDDTPAKENPAKDFNKLDLSQLQGFSFGTQWTQDKVSPSESRERSDRPRREGGDRREGMAPDRRDRRTFRRPAGGDSAPGGPAGGPQSEQAPRREYSGERGPRREYSGPRREGGERGGPRYGGYAGHASREMMDRGPYESPYFSVAFYPEDTSFNALAKTIRSSCRTIELFEIARTVIGKADRFVVVLARKTPETAPAPDAAQPAARPAKQPIYLSVPDGIPFESEEAVVAHVLSNHLGRFFELAEVEVDPPKGNFQVINRCSVTGELLGPPNYHRYAQIVQQHFSAKITRMSFDAYRSRIETVRDPEVVAQWLAKMKTTTRYTWKPSLKAAAAASAPAPAPAAVATEPATPATEAAAAEVAAQQDSTTPETAPAPVITFDAFEDARAYLLANAREKVVRAVETARFHGKLLEPMPPGEIRRAIEGALERQRRFPLDTANALRGRLRREHFTIFKKGSKGISYVCAVKRKFRVPGQTFSETITTLITFIEGSPMIRASELAKKFLGIDVPAPAAGASETPVAAAAAPSEAAPETPKPDEAAKPEAMLTIEQRAKISRMQGDLRWLVTEGYVTEFIDGRLFAPPPMVEARKKEIEAQEHDPENFPEVVQSTPPFEAKPEAAPESAAPTEGAAPASAVEEAVTEAEAQAAAPEPLPESVLTEPERPQVTRPETAPGEPTAPESSAPADEPVKPSSPA
ncbi:hypothetical protein [Opitutus terrae]|uniref:Uncharacterized protein n=1 Tax=Opitutus terrae (strain DSM 11246 / JCM 15787 / PB90-1) TaxID=452637 RepID=B1ZSZ9_OPITP|nr:hypothetical protein [Opitutus terrae]ACB75788.1 hypothetical protein Oter_2506 [Opitutus terrae PB90-1]